MPVRGPTRSALHNAAVVSEDEDEEAVEVEGASSNRLRFTAAMAAAMEEAAARAIWVRFRVMVQGSEVRGLGFRVKASKV